jgi:hypothetical protein
MDDDGADISVLPCRRRVVPVLRAEGAPGHGLRRGGYSCNERVEALSLPQAHAFGPRSSAQPSSPLPAIQQRGGTRQSILINNEQTASGAAPYEARHATLRGK